MQQVAVVLEHRPAAGGVGDDRVELCQFGPVEAERVAVLPPRARRAGSSIAGVVVQRPAAALRRAGSRPRSRSSAARGRWRRFVCGKKASATQPRNSADPRPPLALGRQHLRQRAVVPLAAAAACRASAAATAAAARSSPIFSSSQSRPVHCISRAGARASRVRQPRTGRRGRASSRCSAVQRLRPAGRARARHVHAERLDQLAVLHAGRAGRLARPAVEAQVEVPLDRRRRGRAGRR